MATTRLLRLGLSVAWLGFATAASAQPLDYGDAPDVYGTLLESNGPNHGILAGFSLGVTVDGETNGQPSTGADGDGADEDGVTLPAAFVACSTVNVTVSLTNTAGLATPLLDAWIDFDGDGAFDDPRDRVATSLALTAGANSLPVNVPCDTRSTPTYARFRLSSPGVNSPQGSALDGEVEDWAVTGVGLDFGDAPDPTYATLLASNGARHHVLPADNPTLGTAVDTEPNGQPNAALGGDDGAGTPDDEDGVTFPATLVPGTDGAIALTAGATGGIVSCWIDFNRDGDWNDGGEAVVVNLALSAASSASPSFPVPIGIPLGSAPTRCRISTASGLGATGLAMDGEVEDHPAPIGLPPTITSIAPASGPAAGGTIVTITGTGFSTAPGATGMTFGAAAATAVTCASTTTCQATSPPGAGTVSVRVTVAGLTSADTPADDFTYIPPPPAVTALNPAEGPEAGGTVVTITGTGFSMTQGATGVTFGAAAATAVTCASVTTCQATSPPGTGTGTVSVRVTVAGQTSADTPVDDFTYIPPPTVTTLAPAEGPEAGGTVVTITGTGFSTTSGATSVMFGAAAATAVTCASVTTCQATSPAGTGTVSVHVTVAGQTSADTPADDFTYLERLLYYLTEGATGSFFDDEVAIANPTDTPAPVTLTFFREGGGTHVETATIGPSARLTVPVDAIPGLEATAVSVQIESEARLPLVVERTMFWDGTRYAGHTAGAAPAPAMEWLFAEGAQGYFSTYVLVANPQPAPVDVTVTFLMEDGPPVTRTLGMPAASRLTVDAAGISELANRAFAIRVSATAPVLAERAMYFGTTPDGSWSGGHATAGAAAPATTWWLPEGATGEFFDTFILLGNPQDSPAQVTLTYLLATGETISVAKTIPARGRLTQNIEAESDPRLQGADVSTVVTSDVPIVVERSMYWAGVATPWREAHNTTGLTDLATRWGLAEGRVGGASQFQTFLLLANPQATAAEVTVRYLREDGPPIDQTYVVPARSRQTIHVNDAVPALADEALGARVEVTNGVPIAVERSMYWSANGTVWSGGTNATAIRLPSSTLPARADGIDRAAMKP